MKSTLSEVRSAAARRGASASSAAIAANETAVADGVVKTAPSWVMCDWYYIGLPSDTNLGHGWSSENHARRTAPPIGGPIGHLLVSSRAAARDTADIPPIPRLARREWLRGGGPPRRG